MCTKQNQITLLSIETGGKELHLQHFVCEQKNHRYSYNCIRQYSNVYASLCTTVQNRNLKKNLCQLLRFASTTVFLQMFYFIFLQCVQCYHYFLFRFVYWSSSLKSKFRFTQKQKNKISIVWGQHLCVYGYRQLSSLYFSFISIYSQPLEIL